MIVEAIRSVWRRRSLSSVVAGTLALGIAANGVVFAFAHAWLLRPLPFPGSDRLVVIQTVAGATVGNLSGREVRDLTRDSRLIEDLAAHYPSQYNVTGGGPPEALTCVIATHNLFRVLGTPMLHGDTWSASSDWTEQFLVALSHGVWTRRYGADPTIPGRSVLLDGAPYGVTGVLPQGFAFPQQVDIFRAVTAFNVETIRRYAALARLRSGVSLTEIQGELDGLSARYAEAHPATNRGVRLQARWLRDSYVGSVRPYLLLLAGAVGIVLIIACSNAANLALVGALSRRTDLAIRFALGASRLRLAAGLIVESVVLAAAAGIVAAGLTWTTVSIVAKHVALELPPWMIVDMNGAVLGFIAALSIAAGFGTGAVSALSAMRADNWLNLQAGSRGNVGTRAQRRARSALIAAQVTLTVVVLIGAGLLTKSLLRLTTVDLGLRPQHVMTFRVDPPWKRYPELQDISLFYERAIERLSALPGVTGAAANQRLPLAGFRDITQTVTLPGQTHDGDSKPFVNVQAISSQYTDVMGIPIVRGRTFVQDDRQGKQAVALVSEFAAGRFWPGKDPLGERLLLTLRTRGFGSPNSTDVWVTIIGVTGNVRSQDPETPPALDVYVPLDQAYAGDAYFVLRTPQAMPAPATLAAAIQEVDPDQSIFDARAMAARIDVLVWQRRAAAVIMMIFAGAAFLLAMAGIHGVISISVAERTREIGIRLLLGGNARHVRGLLVRQGLAPVAAGIAMGASLAGAVALGLRAVLFGVSPADPWVFAAVGALVTSAALAASLSPVRRATHVDPLSALKT